MAHTLILATSYDVPSRITHSWASSLPQQLTKANSNNSSTLLSGPHVTQANMTQHLPNADYVIFYGHGELDRLWAQPTGFLIIQQNVLVDVASVSLLQGRRVYAVCCRALHTLGGKYATQFPSGAFIGYGAPFGLSRQYAVLFGAIVNTAAIDFVVNGSGTVTVANLQVAWTSLAAAFLNPNNVPSRNRNAFMAGYLASMNATFVGCRP